MRLRSAREMDGKAAKKLLRRRQTKSILTTFRYLRQASCLAARIKLLFNTTGELYHEGVTRQKL